MMIGLSRKSLSDYPAQGPNADRYSSVNYKIPKSSHIHKSMLLRGVKFVTPMLNSADIRATKGRAQHSGRSFGGAPLNGRGRGGRVEYGSDRPNPFAAHLDPRYGGPPPPGMPMMPPGWVPPTQGAGDYSRGPPPPPRGGMSYYPPGQGHQPPRDYYGQQGHNAGHYSGRGAPDNRGRGGHRGGGNYRGQNRDNRGGGGGYSGRGGGGGGYGRY